MYVLVSSRWDDGDSECRRKVVIKFIIIVNSECINRDYYKLLTYVAIIIPVTGCSKTCIVRILDILIVTTPMY